MSKTEGLSLNQYTEVETMNYVGTELLAAAVVFNSCVIGWFIVRKIMIHHICFLSLPGPFRNDTNQVWADWTLCAHQGASGDLWSQSQLQIQHWGGVHRRTLWLPACTGPLCKCERNAKRGWSWRKKNVLFFSLSVLHVTWLLCPSKKTLTMFFVFIGSTQTVPQREMTCLPSSHHLQL